MLKRIIRKAFNQVGLNVSKISVETPDSEFPRDFDDELTEIIKKCRPYTMTSNERLYQLTLCVKYIEENGIKGDFVECGVWRGGSILAMIETLKMMNVRNRRIHLFDTFREQDIFATNAPTDDDEPFRCTLDELKATLERDGEDMSVNLDDVRDLMKETGYPEENIVFHVGRVEETLPKAVIDSVSLLRLDTDWYDSTKVQLETLFPRVTTNGVVIFDDYGFWKGHKKAVDEYLEETGQKPLLIRTDHSCRFLMKNL
jgi:O-methyltransferase